MLDWLKIEVTGVGDSLGVLERGESRVTSWFWPEHLERWRCHSQDTQEYSWGWMGTEVQTRHPGGNAEKTPGGTALELSGEGLAGGGHF